MLQLEHRKQLVKATSSFKHPWHVSHPLSITLTITVRSIEKIRQPSRIPGRVALAHGLRQTQHQYLTFVALQPKSALRDADPGFSFFISSAVNIDFSNSFTWPSLSSTVQRLSLPPIHTLRDPVSVHSVQSCEIVEIHVP